MDAFDKRAFFYIPLIFGIALFFIIPYGNGIYHWNEIYEEAQRSINNSYWQVRQMRNAFEGEYIWLAIDTRGTGKPIDFNGNEFSPDIIDYDLLINMDSISNSWFDTIVVVKHYTKWNDTIKIALGDL